MVGEEAALSKSMPISDIAYFGAGLDSSGSLVGVPARKATGSYKGRVHLVLAEIGNKALTHFALSPDYPVRKKLLDDLQKAVAGFDGVQIDFEAVLLKDKANYLSFLKSLKIRIGKKALSVALPPRTRSVDDAFDYRAVAALADRVVVMAYDEHWSGSEAGSIASFEWCAKVAEYSLEAIPRSKLVMGAPFYGRAWASANPAKAYRHPKISLLMVEKGIGEAGREEGVPFFEYDEQVHVRVYYEDPDSTEARLRLYEGLKVKRVAFWRLGYEAPGSWERVRLVR
jgi:spore germination protein YaaH